MLQSLATHGGGYNTNLGTNDSPQPNKPTRRQLLAEGVFIIHSAEEKSFAKKLKRDLTNQGVPCKSMSVGEDFSAPPKFEDTRTYRIIVFIISVKFLTTKLLMETLSAYLKARVENHNLKIVPLFFMVPPKALKLGTNNEKWKELEKLKLKWHGELNEIRRTNGLNFSEGDDEVNHSDIIVQKICHIVNSQRFLVPSMQGEERMCRVVECFFDKVQPNKKGIYIVGLSGKVGEGKSTLCKAFCNYKCGDSERKVCYLDFSGGNSFERTKLALQYLTDYPQMHLETLISKDLAEAQLYEGLKQRRVLLVLDNVMEESRDEVRGYVFAEMGENSCILVSARSSNFLRMHFSIDLQSSMVVPTFEDDEKIRLLFERTSLEVSMLGAEDRGIACAIVQRALPFHPLVLKDFGHRLFSKYGSDLSQWDSEKYGLGDGCSDDLDAVFTLLGKDFDKLTSKYCTIFMLLTVYKLPNMSLDKVKLWLGISCNKEIEDVENAVEYLCHKGFIEKFEDEICIDKICTAFAERKAEKMRKWLWCKGEPPSFLRLIPEGGGGFILVKLEQCKYHNLSHISPRYLQNVRVLQLVGVQNMCKVDLGGMDGLRSITIQECKGLTAVHGMENLVNLAWLQISGVNALFELSDLSKLYGLQYIEIDCRDNMVLTRLGDLTECYYVRCIKVQLPFLFEFPILKGLPYLKEVEFLLCDKVKVPLDCRECGELESIVLDSRCKMVGPPLLGGCKATVTVTWKVN